MSFDALTSFCIENGVKITTNITKKKTALNRTVFACSLKLM